MWGFARGRCEAGKVKIVPTQDTHGQCQEHRSHPEKAGISGQSQQDSREARAEAPGPPSPPRAHRSTLHAQVPDTPWALSTLLDSG